MKKLQKTILIVLLILMIPNAINAWTWGGAFNSAWDSIKQTSLQTKLIFVGAVTTIGGALGLWKLNEKAKAAEIKRQEIIKKKNQKISQRKKLQQQITKKLIEDTKDIPQATTDFVKDLSQLNKRVKAEKHTAGITALKKYKIKKHNLLETKSATTIQSLLQGKKEQAKFKKLKKSTTTLQSLARQKIAQKELEQKKIDPLNRSVFDLTGSTVMVQRAPQPKTISLKTLDKKSSWGADKEYGNGRLITFNKKTILDKVFEKTNNESGRVRVIYRYTPSKTTSKKRILFTVVHGTFAKISEEYWYEKAEIFSRIMKYIQSIADEKGITADIISYQWTGINDNERITEGQPLARLFNAIGPHYESINTIAHSHGCNVVNSASNRIDTRVAVIETAIHLASPVMEKNHYDYTPGNIKNLYSFYTFHDIVQWLGSFNKLKSAFNQWVSYFKKQPLSYDVSGRCYAEQKDKNIVNIYFQDDGYQPTHTKIPFYVMPYAKKIIDKHKKEFPGISKVSVNINKDKTITMTKTQGRTFTETVVDNCKMFWKVQQDI